MLVLRFLLFAEIQLIRGATTTTYWSGLTTTPGSTTTTAGWTTTPGTTTLDTTTPGTTTPDTTTTGTTTPGTIPVTFQATFTSQKGKISPKTNPPNAKAPVVNVKSNSGSYKRKILKNNFISRFLVKQ